MQKEGIHINIASKMSRRSQKVESDKYAASAGNTRIPHFRNSRKNGYKLCVQGDKR